MACCRGVILAVHHCVQPLASSAESAKRETLKRQSVLVKIESHITLSVYLGGFTRIGGIEVFFINLLRELLPTKNGLDVFVWGPPRPEVSNLEAFGARIRRSPIARGCRWGIPDHVLALRYIGALWRSDTLLLAKFPPRWFLHLIRLAARFDSPRPRLLYVTSYNPATIWPNGVPSVVDAVLSAVFVQSEGFRDELRALGYTGAVHVVPLLPPPAAQPATPRPSRTGSSIRLGYVGRLSKEKNLGYLFDIVARLTIPVEIHIFGTGPEKDTLAGAARAQGLNVVFHGEVASTTVARHIDTCDVMAITSLYEGQCLAALEALARGRPLFATPVGALPELLERTGSGLLIPQADADTAASSVDFFLKSVNECRSLREDVVVENFVHEFNVNEIIKVYKNTILQKNLACSA